METAQMKRRHWLGTAIAGAVAAPWAASAAVAADPGVARVVDTHTHFYDPTRPQGVPWPPPGTPLHRKVMPADWLALAEPLGIRQTVVVEASPWVDDNRWVLELAAEEKSIVGFVGNLDPTDEQFAANLRQLANNPLFRGIRWRSELVRIDVQRDKVLAGAKLLADLGLELDLNGPATTLPHAAQLAAEVPQLRIVINHLGGSGDPQNIHRQWQANIRELAQHDNVYMKVSALVEQVPGAAGQAPRDTQYYAPVLDHLWECFGEDRLIYGSNWPVSDLGAPYETVFGIVKEYFAGKGQQAAEKYFWKNSLAAYRWVM